MKIDESEAYNSVKTSIEAHRTDVLKAVIDTIKKGLTCDRVTFSMSILEFMFFSFMIQIGMKRNFINF